MSVIERLLRRDGGADVSATSSDLKITSMRRRDLRHGVMAIEAVSYPRPWSEGVFESEISQVRSGTRHYLVARRTGGGGGGGGGHGRGRGRIVGYAGIWFTADEAHVTNIAVTPSEQRRGVATALMLALADEAIRRGAAAWTLEVRVSSTGAQELYRRFGFAPAGVRTRYYENTEDAIVMWCNDIQGADYAELLGVIRSRVAR